MAGLVEELQKDALNPEVKVSQLLRKAYVVATKLNIPDFKDWINAELNGYVSPDKEIPDYRVLRGEVKSYNPFHGMQPVIIQNPEIAEILQNRKTRQSISELEDLVRNPDSDSSLCMTFSQEAENFFLKYSNGLDTRPYLFISRSAISSIIDIVRNTILEWSLKLEEEGITGHGMSFSEAEKKKAEGNQNIHIENFQGILGNVTGSTVHQQNEMNIQKGNFEQLAQFLESNGIDRSDIEELKDAVEEEPGIDPSKGFGSRVSSWIGTMVAKAASGTWKIGCSVAGALLTESLKRFYGLS